MPTAAHRPSSAVAELLRNKRKQFGLTLREVSARVEAEGEPLPLATLGRIERGQLEPGTRRLHLLLQLYDIQPALISELIRYEAVGAERFRSQRARELYDQGIAEWNSGRTDEAFASLMTARMRALDEQESTMAQECDLAVATYARNLGKNELAAYLVDRLLCANPAPDLLWRVLLLAATVWQARGSSFMAEIMTEQALRQVRPGQTKRFAMTLHQQAKLLKELDRPDEAAKKLRHAIKHYRALGEKVGLLRAGLLRVQITRDQGQTKQARNAVARLLQDAERLGNQPVLTSAHLILGEIEMEEGAVQSSVQHLRSALGIAVAREDVDSEFHAQYLLWRGYLQLGDTRRADVARDAALRLGPTLESRSVECEALRQGQAS